MYTAEGSDARLPRPNPPPVLLLILSHSLILITQTHSVYPDVPLVFLGLRRFCMASPH